MKKIPILLGILLIAGVCAMADEVVAVQDDFLFADVDAMALSLAEMQVTDGGQHPDMGGSTSLYSRYTKVEVRDSSRVPTKSEKKESIARLSGDLAIGGDIVAAGIGVAAVFGAPIGVSVGVAAATWGAGRALKGCRDRY